MRFELINPFENFEIVEHFYTKISKDTSHGYFTSWGWISNWLKSLPENEEIYFVVVYLNDKPISGFFLSQKRTRRYGILPTKTFYLNSTGNPILDQLYIEYNSILVVKGKETQIPSLLSYISGLSWDELIIPGADQGFIEKFRFTENPSGVYFFIEEEANSFFVDLETVRKNNMDFLSLLSTNRRSQIRRSIKQYETNGGVIEIKAAQNVDEASVMFEQLVAFHQQEWLSRGLAGAFSNNYLYQFHRNLISSRFGHGEIQLLHIFNKKMTIGYLYNFVYEDRVLLYQSGFNYQAGNANTYRPGIVSHYYAIVYNASQKMLKYDFLAGDDAYKRSLSTGSEKMYWLRLVKSPYRLFLMKFSRSLKEKFTAIVKLLKKH